jgi:hypothetical protein
MGIFIEPANPEIVILFSYLSFSFLLSFLFLVATSLSSPSILSLPHISKPYRIEGSGILSTGLQAT